MKRQNIQPDALAKRVVGGNVLYSHVVVVEAKKTIFVSGQLARDARGEVVGKGDMRTQIRQTGREHQGGPGRRGRHPRRHRQDQHLRHGYRGVLQAHGRSQGVLRRPADEHDRGGAKARASGSARRDRGRRDGVLITSCSNPVKS
jgi:hypothetical protein